MRRARAPSNQQHQKALTVSDNSNPQQTPPHIGVAFLRALFQHTELPVFLCSLQNERTPQAREQRVTTRDGDVVARFAGKWDQRGRGLFLCVSTVEGTRRSKEAAREIPALWTDIDLKAVACSGSEARDALLALPFPPSILVWSGHGWHPWWFLKEPADAQAERDRVERVLRQLADLVGGDTQVCEVSRLMRLPGTHNTKGGEHIEVTIEAMATGADGAAARYELGDLEDWLATARPVIARKPKPARAAVGGVPHETPDDADNPFLRAADILGWKPPIDVQAALAGMAFPGNVHATQLSVSASLLNAGHSVEEVVGILLEATAQAAGADGAKWDWAAEEKALERMCATWVEKHPPPPRSAPRPAQEPPEAPPEPEPQAPPRAGRPDREPDENVINLGAAKAKRKAKAKPQEGVSVAEVVANGVVNALRDRGEDIMLTEGLMWLYRDGIWREATEADEQDLLVLIQLGFKALGSVPRGNSLSLALKHLKEAPALFQRDVPWAGPGTIVCLNGVIQIDRGTFEPCHPQNYARRRIGANYRPGSDCSGFEALLGSMFSDRDDAAELIALLQEWVGAALAIDRLTREERKALVLVGPSRTGKTELARVIRALLGGPVVSPSVEDIGTDFGLQTLLGAVAWIRDDAINEGDKVDPQRFKTVITGEPIDVRRKGKVNARSTSFCIPVLLTANTLPRARDVSDAIFNRSLVVDMTNVIDEAAAAQSRADHGVVEGSIGDHVWAAEGAGILNWALDGLERLRTRGRYDPPESVRTAIQRFKDDNNPVGEWARDALEPSPNTKIDRADLCCAFHGWQAEELGEGAKAMGAQEFFRRLRPILGPTFHEATDHGGRRYFTGYRLTEGGLRYWEAHNLGPQLRNGNVGRASGRGDVNKVWSKTAENGPRF